MDRLETPTVLCLSFGLLLTTVILAGTLVLQTVQIMNNERGKSVEQSWQQGVTEDPRIRDGTFLDGVTGRQQSSAIENDES